MIGPPAVELRALACHTRLGYTSMPQAASRTTDSIRAYTSLMHIPHAAVTKGWTRHQPYTTFVSPSPQRAYYPHPCQLMNYCPKADHRQPGALHKSQWTISVADERSCFELAATSSWRARESYWGVYVPGGSAEILGVSQAPERHPVFIAKFITNQSEWHGYPVAHWRSTYDKPSTDILEEWRARGYIRKKTVKRVIGGRRCKP
jgi:hypothetical protein